MRLLKAKDGRIITFTQEPCDVLGCRRRGRLREWSYLNDKGLSRGGVEWLCDRHWTERIVEVRAELKREGVSQVSFSDEQTLLPVRQQKKEALK